MEEKKWWYRKEYVGDKLVHITSYGHWDIERIERLCKRDPDRYDPKDWTIELFDNEEDYLKSLEQKVLESGCGVTYTNFDADNLNAHRIIKDLDRRRFNTPEPIIKDGKAICPMCGQEIYRSDSVILTNPPIYTYYCTNCIYRKETGNLIKEAKNSEYGREEFN